MPESRPDDGCLWLLLVRAGVSARDLASFVKAAERRGEGEGAAEAREFGPLPEGIELLKVRGLRLAPLDVQVTKIKFTSK